MSLAPNVPNLFDPANPGEHWFLYWKTSASLWRAKLGEMRQVSRLIVPINWAFHSETGDRADFGVERPETDLRRLLEIASEFEKEVCFFLPLTPAPFLVNGGVPHLLARQLSLDPRGQIYSFLDPAGPLIKFYSFFDPRVFQGFAKFVQQLAAYFHHNQLVVKIWGIECGSIDAEGRFQSFLLDSSKAYEQSFTRFLALDKEETEKTNRMNKFQTQTPPPMVFEGVDSITHERKMSKKFVWTIRDLYRDMAKKELGQSWEGLLSLSFIGCHSSDFLNRACDTTHLGQYSEDILYSLNRGIIPSAIMLGTTAQRPILKRQMDELVLTSMLPAQLDERYFDEDRYNLFIPLSFFRLYRPSESVPKSAATHIVWENVNRVEERWQAQGLKTFLFEHFQWAYELTDIEKFHFDESIQEHRRIHIIDGELIDQKVFHALLKVFMSGGKLLIDRSVMPALYLRKLESFFLENALKVERINFLTGIHSVSLGDGRLILYEGDGLKNCKLEEQCEFWNKLVQIYDLVHLGKINGDKVTYFWKTRSSSPSELNYEEIRRLALYNNSSYKKRIQISLTKNFVLMKILDEVNAVVQSYPNEIEVHLLPEGAVSLDLGVFSV